MVHFGRATSTLYRPLCSFRHSYLQIVCIPAKLCSMRRDDVFMQVPDGRSEELCILREDYRQYGGRMRSGAVWIKSGNYGNFHGVFIRLVWTLRPLSR